MVRNSEVEKPEDLVAAFGFLEAQAALGMVPCIWAGDPARHIDYNLADQHGHVIPW